MKHDKNLKKVIVLGAGSTGLVAAWKLLENRYDVAILEKMGHNKVNFLIMFKTMIKNTPFVGCALMHIRAWTKGKRGELNNIVLLKKHQYHNDFNPIYNLVVKKINWAHTLSVSIQNINLK